eukprot:g16529.t1
MGTGAVLRVESGTTPRQEQSRAQHQAHHEPAMTTTGRREGGGERIVVTQENLPKMKNVVILQDEGIIYCPIAKVASAEWKRSLRWMVGIEDWMGEHTSLHSAGKNGLERLMDWGLEGVQWALESDRYLRFVVVRDPAERLVSAFLNKCVTDGYMSGRLTRRGAPGCAYLSLMPELFPNTTQASLATHQRLRELVEEDPEDTFYSFSSGIWAEMQSEGDPCRVSNHHVKPQVCFCDLLEVLPAFHVIPFSNMSAEAAAFAARIPKPLPEQVAGVANSDVGMDGKGGMRQRGKGTGVDASRRKEIRAFLTERFVKSHDEDVKVTRAGDLKSVFLSERVVKIVHKMFVSDYEVLGQYFPPESLMVSPHGR